MINESKDRRLWLLTRTGGQVLVGKSFIRQGPHLERGESQHHRQSLFPFFHSSARLRQSLGLTWIAMDSDLSLVREGFKRDLAAARAW
jgi:hypothetical protein